MVCNIAFVVTVEGCLESEPPFEPRLSHCSTSQSHGWINCRFNKFILPLIVCRAEMNSCTCSCDLISPALSLITTTRSCSWRISAIFLYHFLITFNISSLVFMPYSHLYPEWQSTITIAWEYPSMDTTDDEKESMFTCLRGLSALIINSGKSSRAFPYHTGCAFCMLLVGLLVKFFQSFDKGNSIVDMSVGSSLLCHFSYPEILPNCCADIDSALI